MYGYCGSGGAPPHSPRECNSDWLIQKKIPDENRLVGGDLDTPRALGHRMRDQQLGRRVFLQKRLEVAPLLSSSRLKPFVVALFSLWWSGVRCAPFLLEAQVEEVILRLVARPKSLALERPCQKLNSAILLLYHCKQTARSSNLCTHTTSNMVSTFSTACSIFVLRFSLGSRQHPPLRENDSPRNARSIDCIRHPELHNPRWTCILSRTTRGSVAAAETAI